MSKLRIVVVSITYRTLMNIHPTLARLQASGAEVRVVWLPPPEQLPGQDPSDADLSAVLRTEPGAGRNPGSSFWDEFSDLLRSFQPDLVLSDDMTNLPCRDAYERAKNASPRPVFAAFQHGLYQTWHQMDAEFPADYFLCFGSQHVYNFSPGHWPRVLPVGLPKLDRLQEVEATSGEHILYFAQFTPEPEIVERMLLGLSEAQKAKVAIRPHPAYLTTYAELGKHFEILDPTEDPIAQIAACKFMVTSHSTAVLEALLLGKLPVVIPSFGLTDFSLFPFVSRSFRPGDLNRALDHLRNATDPLKRYLEVTCAGQRFDSTERMCRTLVAIVESHKQNPARGWWLEDSALGRAVADQHPLQQIARLC